MQPDVKNNNEEQTPLHYAAKIGSWEIMKMLLDAVINVKFALEMKDFQGRNVFYLATVYGMFKRIFNFFPFFYPSFIQNRKRNSCKKFDHRIRL